jgi:hypothetical protein
MKRIVTNLGAPLVKLKEGRLKTTQTILPPPAVELNRGSPPSPGPNFFNVLPKWVNILIAVVATGNLAAWSGVAMFIAFSDQPRPIAVYVYIATVYSVAGGILAAQMSKTKASKLNHREFE